MVKKHKVISYKRFLIKRNNFACHFFDNWFGDIYRKSEAYIRCAQENKNNFLAQAEALRTTLRIRRDFENPENVKALYQLYILLHEYVEDDADLFR